MEMKTIYNPQQNYFWSSKPQKAATCFQVSSTEQSASITQSKLQKRRQLQSCHSSVKGSQRAGQTQSKHKVNTWADAFVWTPAERFDSRGLGDSITLTVGLHSRGANCYETDMLSVSVKTAPPASGITRCSLPRPWRITFKTTGLTPMSLLKSRAGPVCLTFLRSPTSNPGQNVNAIRSHIQILLNNIVFGYYITIFL